MATNYPYYPSYYNPQNYPQAQQQSGIVWVQGEAGAKSYLVGAGQSVLLMDSETSKFYIKTTDASGMPLPLRVFDYKELTQAPATQSEFVTRSEFEELKARLEKNEPSV